MFNRNIHYIVFTAFTIIILLGCSNEFEKKFINDKETFSRAQEVLSKNFNLFKNDIKRINKYSEIISLNENNIAQMDSINEMEKRVLLDLFKEKKVIDISLYNSECFLFLIESENGFLNSEYHYYLFYQNNDCIKSIESDFDITNQVMLADKWLYLTRRGSLAN